MMTTIQISDGLKKELSKRKMYDRETYEDVIWDLIESTMELSEETKRAIAQSRKEYKQGKTYTLEEVKKQVGL